MTLAQADFKVAGTDVNFKDVWVEIYDTSNLIRDIEVKLTYKQNEPYTVKATGVWVTPTAGFRSTGASYGDDADDVGYQSTFKYLYRT